MNRHFLRLTYLFLLFVSATTLLRAEDDKKAPAAPKDTLVFVNGDKLTGTLERSDAKTLTFKSDLAGEITVGWDKVQDLKTVGSFAVLPKGFRAQGTRKLNNAQVPQGTLTVADNTVSVQQGMGAPAQIPVAQTEFIVDQKTYEQQLRGKPEFWQGWKGAVQAGASVVRSTTDTVTWNAGFNFARVVPTVSWIDPRTRDTLNFLDTFGKTVQMNPPTGTPPVAQPNSYTETSIMHAEGEHDIYFTPRVYALGNVQYDHNYSQGLDLQQIYGGGIGMTLFKDAKQQLDIKAQAQYEHQSFEVVPGSASGTASAPSTDLFGATFAENYMRKLGKKGIVFTEQLQFLPAFNQTNDYSANGLAAVAMPLFKNFNFSVSVTDSYLNDPAEFAKRNSLQAITALQYTIK